MISLSSTLLLGLSLCAQSDIIKDISRYDLIPHQWSGAVVEDLCSFNHAWEVEVNKSDSISDLLGALGQSWSRRRAVKNFKTVVTFDILGCGCYRSSIYMEEDRAICPAQPHIAYMQTMLPFGLIRKSEAKISGEEHVIREEDTGNWMVSSLYYKGWFIQRRYSPKHGLMFDVRAVIVRPRSRSLDYVTNTQNFGIYTPLDLDHSNPSMFLHMILITPNEERLVVNRWFKNVD